MDKQTRAWELLEKLSFVRVSGTDEELRAANLIKEECEKLGVKAEIEEFEVETPIIECASLTRGGKSFKVVGLGQTASTPDEGVTGELVYCGNGEDANLLNIKDKIVLLNMVGRQRKEMLEKLIKRGAKAFVVITGSVYDDEDLQNELPQRSLRLEKEVEKLPGLMIHIKDVEELLATEGLATLLTKQDGYVPLKSHNVVATIEGSEVKDEEIVFSAHFDSVLYSQGAWDNATGSITIFELMRHFIENPPYRTVKFVWCGSEEVGLNGSRAYVEMHENELENIKLNINVDMTGITLGYDTAVCTCDPSLVSYIDYLGKEEGFAITPKQDVYPSDSTSFAAKGVPAVTFARLQSPGGKQIHSRRDDMTLLDKYTFYKTVDFMITFSEKMVKAKIVPVPREMPKDLKAKLEEMGKAFGAKKKDEHKEEKK